MIYQYFYDDHKKGSDGWHDEGTGAYGLAVANSPGSALTWREKPQVVDNVDKMKNIRLFPLANDDHRAGGWTLDVKFLTVIQKAALTNGEDVSLEGVEAVLLAAEAHVIQAVIEYRGK